MALVSSQDRREVGIKLPPASKAPAFATSLTDVSGFRTRVDDGFAWITPPEDAPLLTAHRLARPGESRSRLWEYLERFPRREAEIPLKAKAIAEVNRLLETQEPEGLVAALSLLLLVTSNDEIRPLFDRELDGIFAAFPEANLWMVGANDPLLGRVALVRIAFALANTPDVELGSDSRNRSRSLTAQSLTQGVSFAGAVQPIFLALTPAATGFAFSWLPHSLMLEYGAVVDLRSPPPGSMASLYMPNPLGPSLSDATDKRGRWVNDVPKSALSALLQWWVSRLDALFHLATDPTRFVIGKNMHDSAGQMGFMLTLERTLADMCVLGASPQDPPVVRLGVAFDLLDKLESLLGYGPSGRRSGMGSGRGFERLLNRDETLPAVRRAFGTMPRSIASPLMSRAEDLFESVYEDVASQVVGGRATPEGVLVDRASGVEVPWSTYVGTLTRLIRNSSHGLLDQLAGNNLGTVASHSGALPLLLPELVMMISFAVLSDPERLADRSFWQA